MQQQPQSEYTVRYYPIPPTRVIFPFLINLRNYKRGKNLKLTLMAHFTVSCRSLGSKSSAKSATSSGVLRHGYTCGNNFTFKWSIFQFGRGRVLKTIHFTCTNSLFFIAHHGQIYIQAYRHSLHRIFSCIHVFWSTTHIC